MPEWRGRICAGGLGEGEAAVVEVYGEAGGHDAQGADVGRSGEGISRVIWVSSPQRTSHNVMLTICSSAPPFDRHDWYVQRTLPSGQTREIRYVIDYYEGPEEPTGEPVFYLDVRPAVDGPAAAAERMMRWGGDVWHRASGAKARQ